MKYKDSRTIIKAVSSEVSRKLYPVTSDGKADSKKWQTDFVTIDKRIRIPRGLDADKDISPKNGAAYMALDTKTFYVCFEDGVWEIIGGSAGITGVKVRKNSGALIGTRPQLNLIEGIGVGLTVADDPADNEIDITITAQAVSAVEPLDTPQDLAIGTADEWTDIDVSLLVPVGATGVILHIISITAAGGYAFGLRKKGSTDNRIDIFGRNITNTHAWAMVGIDANRKFQVYADRIDCQFLKLVGYTTGGVVFFANGVEKVPPAFGSWQDIDVTGLVPANAIAVILELTGATKNNSVRKNGSSVDSHWGTIANHMWAFAGLDGSQLFEAYMTDVNTHLYVMGYIIAGGAYFPTNFVGKTPAVIDSWQIVNCAAQAPSAEVLFMLSMQSAGGNVSGYGFRENGALEDIHYREADQQAWGIVPCDDAQKIQAWTHVLAAANQAQYLVGYA